MMSATNIVVSEFINHVEGPQVQVVFIGNFTYDVDGNPSGTVDTIQLVNDGLLLEVITTVAVDIVDLLSAASNGGFENMFDVIFTGDDVFIGSDDTDEFFGFGGNDVMIGGGSNNWLAGGEGNDSIYGGQNNDFLYGGKGADIIYGYSGNDQILGGARKDMLYGGKGADWVIGEGGKDKLYGGKGNDKLMGGTGNDKLFGGAGKDILYVGIDINNVPDFDGHNILKGGAGNDSFVFLANGDGVDVIKDFTDGEDLLYLLGYGITSAAEARAYATMVDGDTVFDFGANGTIVVENFHKSNFRAVDFSFAWDAYISEFPI